MKSIFYSALLISSMLLPNTLNAQQECLTCMFGRNTEASVVKKYLMETLGLAHKNGYWENQNKRISLTEGYITEYTNTNTSYANESIYFSKLFQQLGIKSTHKETKKAASRFIIDSGKNSYKDPWLDIYDPDIDFGIKITWEKKNSYLFYRFRVYKKEGKPVNLPWCGECDISCEPSAVINQAVQSTNGVWDLLPILWGDCEYETLIAIAEDSEMNKANGLRLSFDLDQESQLEYISDLAIDLNQWAIELPRGISKTSTLADLEAEFGVMPPFDKRYFEVDFGSGHRDAKFRFVLNETQSGIDSVYIFLKGHSNAAITSDFSAFDQGKKGCPDCDEQGSCQYCEYFYSNDESFYGTVKDFKPYDGQINGSLKHYNLEEEKEKERLANRTAEEIQRDNILELARATAELQREKTAEYNREIQGYFRSMDRAIGNMNTHFQSFLDMTRDAYHKADQLRKYEYYLAEKKLPHFKDAANKVAGQAYQLKLTLAQYDNCPSSYSTIDIIYDSRDEFHALVDYINKTPWKRMDVDEANEFRNKIIADMERLSGKLVEDRNRLIAIIGACARQ